MDMSNAGMLGGQETEFIGPQDLAPLLLVFWDRMA